MSDYTRRTELHREGNGQTNGSSEPEFSQEMGNSAAQDMMKVEGALGRVFNRIAGVAESNTDPAGLAFKSENLKTYLDDQLGFAKGEWFRSAKIGGVADKIMETLDADKDGQVTWLEFQAMVDEMRQHLVGDLSPSAGASEMEAKASEIFAQLSGGQDSVDYDTIKNATEDKLPDDQEHKGLIAQLAALMVLDIVDLDERETAVRDRAVSESEWLGAVHDFSRS